MRFYSDIDDFYKLQNDISDDLNPSFRRRRQANDTSVLKAYVSVNTGNITFYYAIF